MEESRKVAKAGGLKRYVSKYPCPSDHIPSVRYTINGQCVVCKNTARNERRPKLTNEVRSRLARQAHLERLMEKAEQWQRKELKLYTSRSLRPVLIYIHGNKCSHCGIAEWNGKSIVFEVEHKDGNSENNSPENVCLICPNCHSQTPTYKGANRGNGRHFRRKRYAEGKSY
jgi:hypothetical protein